MRAQLCLALHTKIISAQTRKKKINNNNNTNHSLKPPTEHKYQFTLLCIALIPPDSSLVYSLDFKYSDMSRIENFNILRVELIIRNG